MFWIISIHVSILPRVCNVDVIVDVVIIYTNVCPAYLSTSNDIKCGNIGAVPKCLQFS